MKGIKKMNDKQNKNEQKKTQTDKKRKNITTINKNGIG